MNGRGRFDCLCELPHPLITIIQGNGAKVNQNIFNNYKRREIVIKNFK